MTKIAEILQLYPTAKLSESPDLTPEKISFLCAEGYVNLEKAELTEKEIALLQVMLGHPIKHHDVWQAFLCGKGERPSVTGQIRFIQAKVTLKNSEFSAATWATALQELLSGSLLGSFRNGADFVLVEQVGPATYQKNDFLGVASTLDSELNTQTKFFIGDAWPVEFDLPKLFAEEQAIFAQVAAVEPASVLTTENSALRYFTGTKLSSSYLLKSYRQLFVQDPQLKEIIQVLYHTQGNQTLTAKKLYLHRNSLQYKLNRFMQESGFDLKQMDDLLFCYLLTL